MKTVIESSVSFTAHKCKISDVSCSLMGSNNNVKVSLFLWQI